MLFAQLRIAHVDFLADTVTVMRHKFLKDWSDERDAIVYPPGSGKYSVFTTDQIVEHFAFLINAYYAMENDSFASFSYDTSKIKHHHHYTLATNYKRLQSKIEFDQIPPIKLCIERIADVEVQNNTYIFDISQIYGFITFFKIFNPVILECSHLNFTKSEIDEIAKDPHSIRHMLVARNVTFRPEDALIVSKALISFNLRTIHFSPVSSDQKPECYLIKVSRTFRFLFLISDCNYAF